MNEFQEPYEKEISLTELLFFCLKKWRCIVVAMLVLGALAGAYKYQSTVSANQAKRQMQLEAEESEEEESEAFSNPNLDYYNLSISNHEKKIREMRAYINDSVIMQLDPYNLDTGNLSFCFVMEETDEALRKRLLSGYEEFVTDGRLAEAMLEADDDDISESEMQYLIKYENKEQLNAEENYVVIDGSAVSLAQISEADKNRTCIFQIQLTADSERNCRAYMVAARRAVESLSAELQEQLGAHTLTLMSESQTKRIDSNILAYQKDVLNNYTNTYSQLKTLKTELETAMEEQDETITADGEVIYANPLKEAIKFVIVGLVLGAFAGAFLLVVLYLMSGKLRSLEKFREEFGMPLLGQITKAPAKKRLFGFVDSWLQRLEEGEYADITYEEQLKLAAANLKTAVSREAGISKVMIAGTMARDEAEDFCSRLRPELEGVSLSGYERIVFQASALEELDSYDGVVFLEKKGYSYEKLIKKERELVADRGVRVLGAIVL